MSDVVARLRGPIPVSAFNAAGVVERYDASPSPLDLEAADEIERLRSELAAARSAALEEAAKKADRVRQRPGQGIIACAVADEIAAAIRELKDK